MTTRLYVMRHARALHTIGTVDFERKLAPRGIAQAQSIGRQFQSAGVVFDAVVHSQAVRTTQTWLELSSQMEPSGAEVTSVRRLYAAGHEVAAEELRELQGQPGNVLLVGHEPTMGYLVEHLCGVEDPIAKRVCSGMSTGFVFEIHSQQPLSQLGPGWGRGAKIWAPFD